jgi:hypothetical protein
MPMLTTLPTTIPVTTHPLNLRLAPPSQVRLAEGTLCF